jgi:hypothetical protein
MFYLALVPDYQSIVPSGLNAEAHQRQFEFSYDPGAVVTVVTPIFAAGLVSNAGQN